MNRCTECDGTNTVYQVYSGGREYYCPDCDHEGTYASGEAPRRVQMIADRQFDLLRAEMREHFKNE